MKKSIIYLGLALVTFTNVTLALNCQQSFVNEDFNLTQEQQPGKNFQRTVTEDHSRDRKGGKESEKQNSDHAELVVFNPYEKTVEEIIAEDMQIIENAISNEVQSTATGLSETDLSDEAIVVESIIALENCRAVNGPTIEQVIAEDSKIVEGTVVNLVVVKANGCKSKKEII